MSQDASATILLNPEEMRRCFRARLERAQDIRIAVAWVRPSWPVKTLVEAGKPVDAVIGTHFAMTSPDALDALKALRGSVRVIEEGAGGVFHPKVYWFRRGQSNDVIVGSHNATAAAFEENEEVSVHLPLRGRALDALQAQWKVWQRLSRPVSSSWLREYEGKYERARDRLRGRMIDAADGRDGHASPQREAVPEAPGGLLSAAWREYLRALFRTARKRGTADVVDGPDGSYLTTLRLCRPIVRSPLPQPGTTEFHRLIGDEPNSDEPDTGWFGRLSGGGKVRHLLGRDQKLRRDIHRLLRSVISARREEDVRSEAERFFHRIDHVHGLANATATRLLTLARPDRFFSVNGPSVAHLAGLLSCAQARLKTKDGYFEALDKVWCAPWYASGRPADRREQAIWNARVALLDVFAYDPTRRFR